MPYYHRWQLYVFLKNPCLGLSCNIDPWKDDRDSELQHLLLHRQLQRLEDSEGKVSSHQCYVCTHDWELRTVLFKSDKWSRFWPRPWFLVKPQWCDEPQERSHLGSWNNGHLGKHCCPVLTWPPRSSIDDLKTHHDGHVWERNILHRLAPVWWCPSDHGQGHRNEGTARRFNPCPSAIWRPVCPLISPGGLAQRLVHELTRGGLNDAALGSTSLCYRVA